MRFPDSNSRLLFHGPTDEPGRVKAIGAFLAQAHAALAPYNVFQSADIFGYVFWNTNDTGIGQKLESVVDIPDYVCPMLYPSGFRYGIPGHPDPLADPYTLIRLSLENGVRRTHSNPRKFRPWLQAFRDYAFDHRVFGPDLVSAQTRAAADAHSDGYMLCNPRNSYSGRGLRGESGGNSRTPGEHGPGTSQNP